MNTVRHGLLLEIVKQCRFIMKANFDLKTCERALQSMAAYAADPSGFRERAMADSRQILIEIGYAQQALLTAAGIVSQCLGWQGDASDKPTRESLRSDLGIDDNSVLKNRDIRNTFEHIDERIVSLFSDGATEFIDSNVTSADGGVDPLENVNALRHINTRTGEIRAQGRQGQTVTMNYFAIAVEAAKAKKKGLELLSEMHHPEGTPGWRELRANFVQNF
jgi:hypothetical protein